MSNMHNLEIDLDLKESLLVTATCKQGDNLNLIFNIWDNGIQTDLTPYDVELRALKSDLVPLTQDLYITVVGNVVTIKADKQLTTTSGIVQLELLFINKATKEKKYSFNLELNVKKTVLEVNRSISKPTCDLLERLENSLDEVRDIGDNLEEAKQVNNDLKNNTIPTGTALKESLETNITAGTTLNTKLENNIEIGTKLNTDLEGNITEGSTLKENLEANILTGTTLKTELEEDIKEGSTLDAALKEDIKNANTTKGQLAEVKQQADTSKENLETATTTANTTKEELTDIDTTAKKTIEDLQVENVLADKKIETLKKLDPNNVLEDVGNLKQEVTEARGVYPNLNKRIENIIGKDVANLYIGETEPSLDGLWVDTTENVGEFGSSDLLEDIKDYVNTDINPKIEENKKNIESINRDLNKNTQDINDLKTKKADLATTPQQTTENRIYYISPTGSDEQNEGTQEKPFKSIQKVFNILSKNIRNIITINLAEGVYDENLAILGFYGDGEIYINGAKSLSDTHNIKRIISRRNKIYIRFFGINFTCNDEVAVYTEKDDRFIIDSCKINNSEYVNYSGVITLGSLVEVTNCIINNRSTAIYARLGSMIMSTNNQGTGNVYGLSSDTGAVIAKNGVNQPLGTNTNEVANAGGVIR